MDKFGVFSHASAGLRIKQAKPQYAMNGAVALDRLAMRARPQGNPVVHQSWHNLLFLHWSFAPETIQPLLPRELELDTFDDKAWIGVTPFTMNNVHLRGMPAIPGLSAFHELNVRTYVHYQGMPGVYFFSLDASRTIPAVAARVLFMLPYHSASITFEEQLGEYQFELARLDSPAAHFRARWQTGIRLRDPDVCSLAFFLTERYCYWTVREQTVYSTRIYHHPWILNEAVLSSHASTMIGALGLIEPAAQPLAYFAREQNVEVWAPSTIS